MHNYRFIVATAAALLLCGCGSARVRPQITSGDPTISVEQESTMFYVLSKQTGQRIVPGIDIYENGTCRVRTPFGNELTQRIKPSKVRELLRFFEGEGLQSISNELLERRINDAYPFKRAIVVDSHDTRINVKHGNRSVRLSRYALDMELEYYPEVKELRTIQNCVDRVCETVGTKR